MGMTSTGNQHQAPAGLPVVNHWSGAAIFHGNNFFSNQILLLTTSKTPTNIRIPIDPSRDQLRRVDGTPSLHETVNIALGTTFRPSVARHLNSRSRLSRTSSEVPCASTLRTWVGRLAHLDASETVSLTPDCGLNAPSLGVCLIDHCCHQRRFPRSCVTTPTVSHHGQ